MPPPSKKKSASVCVDDDEDDTTAVKTSSPVFVSSSSAGIRRKSARNANKIGGDAGASTNQQHDSNNNSDVEEESDSDYEDCEDANKATRGHGRGRAADGSNNNNKKNESDTEAEEGGEEYYSSQTVVNLRQLCKERGLKQCGKKQDIIDRLIDYDSEEEDEEPNRATRRRRRSNSDDDDDDDDECTNNNNTNNNNKKNKKKGNKKKKATGGTAAGHGGNGGEEAPKKKRGVVPIREQIERIKQAYERGVVNEDGVADSAVWRENGYNNDARNWFLNNWTDTDGRPLPEPDGIEDFLRPQTISTQLFGGLSLGEVTDRLDAIAEYSYSETGDRQAVIPHPTISIVGRLLKKSGSDDYTICEAVHNLIHRNRANNSEKVKAMLDYLIEHHLCWAGMDGSNLNGAGHIRYQEEHQDAGAYAAVILLMNNIAIPKNLKLPVGLTHLYAEDETALKVALLTVKSRRYKIHYEAAGLQKKEVFQPIWVGQSGDNWKNYEDVGRDNDDFEQFLRDKMSRGKFCRECMGECITKDDAVGEEEQECNDENITEDDAVLEEEQQEHQEEGQQVQDFRRSINNQSIDHLKEARKVKWMHTMMKNGKKVAKQPSQCTLQQLQAQEVACKKIRDNGGEASLDMTCTDHHRMRDNSSASQVLSGKIPKENTHYGDLYLNRLAIKRKAIVLIALHESGVDLETLDVDAIVWPKVTIHCAYSGLPIRYGEMEIADSHHVLESGELELEYNGVCYKVEGMAKTDIISDIMHGDSQRGYVERLSDQLSITVAICASVHRLTHKGMSMIEKGQVAGVESPIVFHRAEKRVIINASTHKQFQQFLPAEALVARDDDNEAEDEVKDVVEASLSSDANKNDNVMDVGDVMAVDEDRDRFEAMNRELSKLQCKVAELEAAVASGQGIMEHENSENADVSADVSADVPVEEAFVSLMDSLKTEQEHGDRSETTIRQLSTANTQLQREVSKLRAALTSSNGDNSMLKRENATLRSLVDKRIRCAAAMQDRISDLRDDVKHHVAEKDEMSANMATMLGTITQLNKTIAEERANNQRDVEVRDNAIARHKEEIESLVEKMGTMQVKHNTHVEELTDAHRDEKDTMMRECNQTIESMENRVAASDAAHAVAIATKDEEMSDLREQCADRVAASDAAHAVAIATKDEEMSGLREECADRVAALEAANAREISTKDEEMSALEAVHAAKDEEMADMQIDLRNACNSYHFYRRKTNNMQRQIDELMEEAEHKADVLGKKDDCIIDYEEEVECLHEELECRDVELQATKAALSEYESSTVIQMVSGIVLNSRKRRRVSVNNDDN